MPMKCCQDLTEEAGILTIFNCFHLNPPTLFDVGGEAVRL